jgi:ABC-2 type transport system permease protein
MSRLFRDSWLMFRSQMRVALRNFVWLFIGLFQPICFMLLFAPLLKNLPGTTGFSQGSAYNTFTPGLMMMLAIYYAGFAGFAVLNRLQSGVIERLRVTPVSRLAMMLGFMASDLVVLIVQMVLLVGVGLMLGFRPDGWGLVITVGLLLLCGAMMIGFSYGLALTVKEQSALAASTNLLVLPLLLLSGIMLPLSLAPQVLRDIARANPFAYAVDAARALTAGNYGAIPVGQAFVIIGCLAVAMLAWATASVHAATE